MSLGWARRGVTGLGIRACEEQGLNLKPGWVPGNEPGGWDREGPEKEGAGRRNEMV